MCFARATVALAVVVLPLAIAPCFLVGCGSTVQPPEEQNDADVKSRAANAGDNRRATTVAQKPSGKPRSSGLDQLPRRLGAWVGTDKEIDPVLYAAIGCEECVDRQYRREGHKPISLHVSMFADYDKGIFDPGRAYEGIGYTYSGASDESLDLGRLKHLRAVLTRWKNNTYRALVLHWYQIGDRSLRDKDDLFDLRLRGEIDEKQGLPLVKVLLHAPEPETEKDLLELATAVAKWLNGCE